MGTGQMIQRTNVKIVASPDRVRLVIDGNIKHEQEIIDYEVLFQQLEEAIPQATFHYEWTPDLKQYDQDSAEVVQIQPGEVIETSTDIQVVASDDPDRR